MIKAPVRLIRLTYPERDLLLKKLQQFGEDPDAFFLLNKLANQSANLLMTDDEIEALLDKLQMLRKDTDAQYLGEKISNLQTQLPSDVPYRPRQQQEVVTMGGIAVVKDYEGMRMQNRIEVKLK